MSEKIPSPDVHPRRRVAVLDSEMCFVDTNPAATSGRTVVFLHGNPTSSYLWRNVIPHVQGMARCLAPDLIGMGQSGKPDCDYRFADHARYLDAWFEAVLPTQAVLLVVHDWGSALGLHWARRHASRVVGIAYMEALVQPRLWSDFPHGRDQIFRALRGERGEPLVREENFFVETVLARSVLTPLAEADMNAYRAPFMVPASRLPTLAWARELPIEGEPAEVCAIVEDYAKWMSASPVPKLFVNVQPGALLGERARALCRQWPNQREVTVAGIHYPQEDSPDAIGSALQAFLAGLPDEAFSLRKEAVSALPG